jgi:hypothetical protein
MVRTLGWIALLCAALPAAMTVVAADVYRWTDKDGKVHYSDTPPPGNKSARPIDLPNAKPGAPDLTIAPKAAAPAQAAPQAPAPVAAAPQQAPAVAPRSNRGMSFDTYVLLRAGMSEGELIQRAGEPDYASSDGVVGSTVRRGRRVETFSDLEFKKFYYYPTPSDPFTTVVTLTGGYISDLQRTRQF